MKKTKHLNPAEYAIFIFGGATVLAREIGLTRSSVNKWKGYGHIPANKQLEILKAATKKRIDLTEIDLIHGRKI